MKKENLEYIMKEILPNDADALRRYINEQAAMVLGKMCMIKGISVSDMVSVELEAMLLAGWIHTGLIDACLGIGGIEK